ncbi:MAG TPA: RHS repeat-associated core domain-containing protein [Pirellulales bacterium]
MADEPIVDGGDAEIRKTTKTSSEYRKAESESHEVERADDCEKRVTASETNESSVKRSETVEIRRGRGSGIARQQPPSGGPLEPPPAAPVEAPAAPTADLPTTLPEKLCLAISGVRPEGCAEAALFDGDYILDLVDRDAAVCRWEVQFEPRGRLYRASLTARSVSVPLAPSPTAAATASLSATALTLVAELEGGVPGPRWSGVGAPSFEHPLTLYLDPSLAGAIAAGCRWPATVVVAPIDRVDIVEGRVGTAHQHPEDPHFPTAVPPARYDISPRPTAAERAAFKAFTGSGSSSSLSSSSKCGGIDCTTDCHCVCNCPCCKNGTQVPMAAPQTAVPNSPMHIPDVSGRPVRYGNGEITLAVTDLSALGFGLDFTHTRIFSNRLADDTDFGNGYNWLIRDLPHLVEIGADTVMVVRGTRSTNWFDLIDGVYVARFGTKNTLTHNPASGTFSFAVPNGQVTTFNDFGSPYPGVFQSQTAAGGQTMQVVSYAPGTALQIGELQRSSTAGGVTTIESFLYTYSGFDISSLLWRRSTDGGATWTPVRQVLYTYYGVLSTNGSPGDLESATVQTWDGSAWQTIDNHYYRYWTYSGGGALLHCLKYVLNSASYDRMTAAGLDPFTAADAQLAGYADFYLEYDGERHVALETTNGGLYTFTFAFTTNDNPAYFDDYNWKTKTVETRPDGGTVTVYSNYVNDVILKQLANGGDRWIEAVSFNASADVAWYAHPSAVSGYDDTQNNLAIQYNATSGLFRLYTYFGAAAPGYVQSESLRQGTSGTPVLLHEYQYTQITAGGVTIYPTVAVTAYRDDAGTQPLVTSLGYMFFPGTTAVQERTTTWPVVPADQNGSGIAETRSQQFDQWGNAVSFTDERGVVTNFTVDVVTGGLLQRIDDATGMALITDFTIDNLGRRTQSLGPWHTIDIAGVATPVRTAAWQVYQDAINQIWSAQGYALEDGPPGPSSQQRDGLGRPSSGDAFVLINPVSITITDSDNNVTDQIQAIRSTTSGPLLPTDTFPQTSWTRWTHNIFNDNDQRTATQIYYAIPASGGGTRGVNYNETDFGFDSLGRPNRVSNGGGTITRTVHDPRNLPLSIWVGTNDTGAADTDPSGVSAFLPLPPGEGRGEGALPASNGNNMVAVQINEFDGNASGGDGNLTLQTLPVDANPANNRDTAFAYDWRNRQIQTTAAQDWYQVNTLDNLDRAILVQQYSQATNTLIRQNSTNFDNRGRAYQSLRYGVDDNTGAVGNVLIGNTWFDPVGNVLMTLPAGSQAFTASTFDALSRQTVQYVGFYSPLPPGEGQGEGGSSTDTPTYAQALDISGATIVEQTETLFDAASNSIQTTFRQRFHNATGLGPLTQPGGTQPQARVTYAAMYPDGIGRSQAVADYGTNADVPLTRPDTIPASSTAVHVALTLYNNRGEPYQSIDPMGMVDQTTLDDAGRRTQLIRNYQSGQPSTGDVNVTVGWTYTADDQTDTMTAINAATGNQTTSFVYGATLGTSDVARNDVLSSTVYADRGMVSYLVNRQSERKQLTDQNGTVHAYGFDLLGRDISDGITALGAGVDGSVLCIGRSYEVRGNLEHVTSFSDAAGTNVVNDILRVYNSFEQCVNEYQEHNGAVNTATSVAVGYQYADGSANTIRQTGLVYPNGRVITLDYGTGGGIDDALSRVANLIDDDGTNLVSYTRIGVDTFVQQVSAQPQIAWSLINGDGIDPYTGLDQFNQVADNRWYSTATSADLDRIQHGYDLAGNRLYRKNTVAEAAGVYLDELYAYDGLYRLGRLDRGQLNSTNTGIVSGTEDLTQAWVLDATGNWATFNQADTGGSWSLEQTRTANAANEITGISGGGWVVPAYDAAGNAVEMPQSNAPATPNEATYDAWNRIAAVSSGGSAVQQNAYDGFNRRATRLVSGALRNCYSSLNWQSLEERPGGPSSADQQFVWGVRYIDDLVLRDRGTERFYGMQDPNWNLTGIAGPVGTVLERYGYAGYGKPNYMSGAFSALPSSVYDWETLFAGYHWDVSAGWYHVRHRVFHPVLGVWTTRDPRFYMNGPNLYQYALASPLLFTDPSGTAAQVTIVLGPVVVLLAAVLACARPQYTIAMRDFGGRSDKYRHCWVSCRIGKTCGGLLAEYAGLAKEARDRAVAIYCDNFPNDPVCQGGHGDFWDSIEDIAANQACLYWEEFIFGACGGWVGSIFRETCEDCCDRAFPL